MISRSQLILAEESRDVAAIDAALASSAPSLRAIALGALSRVDALTDEHLRAGLADVDRDVRVRAVELSIGRPAIDLVPSLSDSDDLVVETAAWALGEREDDTPNVITALCEVGGKHEISICREAAIAALGAIGAEAGLATILGGLDDRAPVRRRAVLALAPFEGPAVEAALERAANDRDRQVRQAAEDLR